MSSKTPSVNLSADEEKGPKPISPSQEKLSDLANGLVGWDSLDDPHNPQNFKSSRKWFLLGLVSFITFLSPLASSIPAPGIGYTDKTFGVTSSILSALAVSIFVLGFAVGPLILSPLSEIFGRQPVLNCSNFFFTIWQIGCALSPNMSALIVFRLLAGIGGSACLTVGGGIISDLFPLHQRGKANAMFTLGPLFGPVIGPIIGGFIAQRASWRWVYWVLLIACGVVSSINIVTGQETNPVVLLRRKTQRLQKELQNPELRSVYDLKGGAASPTSFMVQSVTRPVRMLARSPILLFLALYMSFVFGLLYLLFTTLTSLYVDTYGWPVDLCGLAYLGIGLGFGLGITVVAKTSDKTVMRLKKANGDVFEPEMRLASCLYFALFIPISFFWYGWTADKQVHWVVPIIGLLPFGFGMMGIFAPIQTYFIDVSGQYAASAVAGLTALRCLFGAFLPLAGPSMYEALGLGWGNSLLGFLALGLTPVPALIYRYGGALRRKHPIRLG
ncbi:MFS general substrate transporter [Aspergillus eucalypticola CBS 122712]|uniref:MFS general substrate transporter n=1 Tax=Aspergillus eucalypticola (strain CBS 122712 / IBT 29274) TaxID=1448314 RepID=A0A317UTN2_ASPEC|nr:MFS general substrate transporter [Aspergillus eucalypticola CBS 122712]PWY65394.1 MFS general substrate transporter [Aspergillus eucalypticola CBS 122712]